MTDKDTWRCALCSATGTGGPRAWEQHYLRDHSTQGGTR